MQTLLTNDLIQIRAEFGHEIEDEMFHDDFYVFKANKSNWEPEIPN